MEVSTKFAVYFFILCGVLGIGNGLKCYQCTWYESGDLNQASQPAQFPDLTSCSWGRKPSDLLLVDCPAEGEEEPGVSYACVSMYVDGRWKGSGLGYVKGTIRQCAYSHSEATTTTNPPENNQNDVTEEKQGKLVDVHRDFENVPGKHFLWAMRYVYNDTESSVKVVACDTDSCKEAEEPVTTEPTTQAVSSTTQDSGAISNVATTLTWAIASIYLITKMY